MDYNKEWANRQLKFSIQELKHAPDIAWLKRSNTLRAIRLIARNLNQKGYYWQAQRIQNWIHFHLKRLRAAQQSALAVKAFLCETCMWYFPTQKICYNPSRTCQYVNDKGLNIKTEITKGCDC